MIRDEAQYQEAYEPVKRDREVALVQRQALVEAGFSPEEVERTMEPLLSFNAPLTEEVQGHEEIVAGHPSRKVHFMAYGQVLTSHNDGETSHEK